MCVPALPFLLDSQRSHRKIDIIVDDDQSLGVCFIERENLADTLTAEIHICLRLDENHFFPADKALSRSALCLIFTDSDAPAFSRQNIDGEKSHVMLCIFHTAFPGFPRPAIIYNGPFLPFRNTITPIFSKNRSFAIHFFIVSPDVLLFASA